jgi:signal transduction histidine kinase
MTESPSRSRQFAHPWLLLGLSVVVAGAACAGVVMFDVTRSRVPYPAWTLGPAVPEAIAFTIAGGVLLRYPMARWIGGVLFGCGAASSWVVFFGGLEAWSVLREWPLERTFELVSSLGIAPGLFGAWILVPQVFPDGPLPGRVWRPLFRASVLAIGVCAVLLLVIGLAPSLDEWIWDVPFSLVALAGVATSLVSLAVRWRRGTRLMRRQISWLCACAVAMVALFGLSVIPGMLPPNTTDLAEMWAPVVWVVAIVVAVLRFQLYDIRVVVRRAAVFGILTVALTLVFIAVYLVVLAGVSSQAAGSAYRWLAVVAACVVVVSSEPARRRLRGWLERRLVGERGDPLRSLARLQAQVADADDAEVFSAVVRTVAGAVRAPGAALGVQRGPLIAIVASTGVMGSDPLVVTLLHRRELLGELRVAARTPGEGYGRSDRALLEQLANQVAALVYGLRRDSELTHARRETEASTVAERVRLGRDLHDGLAPLLAGAGLAAEALRLGMPSGSPDEHEAAQLAARLRGAATEVRNIAHALQPEALAQGGLAVALTGYVSTLSGPNVPHVTLSLRCDVPAEVEQTIYLVALEAVSNAIRHAHADYVEVVVHRQDGQLQLEVYDDGIGLTQPYISGIGITSMRTRIQTFGGVFDISPADPGTRLTARIPVQP